MRKSLREHILAHMKKLMVKLPGKFILSLLLVVLPCVGSMGLIRLARVVGGGCTRNGVLLWHLGSETARALYISPKQPHACQLLVSHFNMSCAMTYLSHQNDKRGPAFHTQPWCGSSSLHAWPVYILLVLPTW